MQLDPFLQLKGIHTALTKKNPEQWGPSSQPSKLEGILLLNAIVQGESSNGS